jgi:signal transduction histidine kinase
VPTDDVVSSPPQHLIEPQRTLTGSRHEDESIALPLRLDDAMGWARRHPRHVDVTVIVVATLLGLAELFGRYIVNDDRVGLPAFGLCLAGGLALFANPRFPRATLAATLAARVGIMALAEDQIAGVPAVIVAVYWLVSRTPRRLGLPAAAVVVVVQSIFMAALETDPFFIEMLYELAIATVPIGFADAARSRQERLRQRIDSEAAERVQAERLRIARDLHDTVAHSLTTIAVQSGVSAHLIDRDVNQARTALTAINDSSRQALEELRGLLGVLRSTDEAQRAPTPARPADLDAIVAQARAGGLRLDVEVSGQFAAEAPEATIIAAHRIITEALTNARRHGGLARTHLGVVHGTDHVRITVQNATPIDVPDSPPSTGVGIIGMRERAQSVGGELHAGPRTDGGFEVTATLPTPSLRPGTAGATPTSARV